MQQTIAAAENAFPLPAQVWISLWGNTMLHIWSQGTGKSGPGSPQCQVKGKGSDSVAFCSCAPWGKRELWVWASKASGLLFPENGWGGKKPSAVLGSPNRVNRRVKLAHEQAGGGKRQFSNLKFMSWTTKFLTMEAARKSYCHGLPPWAQTSLLSSALRTWCRAAWKGKHYCGLFPPCPSKGPSMWDLKGSSIRQEIPPRTGSSKEKILQINLCYLSWEYVLIRRCYWGK